MSDVASPLRPHETLPPVPAWLDEIEGEQALHWVGERNTETLTHLSSPRRDELESSILEILDSPERIPHVSERAGWFYNFWTDAEHPRGLWRRTTPESYLSESETEWELLLDLDALGEQEGHTWVWHGAQVLRSTGKRALITLSDGGSDADLTREFDLETKTFISPEEGSFYRPESKGFLQWADDAGESVLYSNDFGPGSLTASGYPRQARRQKRGQDIADAEILGLAPPTPSLSTLGAMCGGRPGFRLCRISSRTAPGCWTTSPPSLTRRLPATGRPHKRLWKPTAS